VSLRDWKWDAEQYRDIDRAAQADAEAELAKQKSELVWRCPEHGEVSLSFCRGVGCRFNPHACPDPAGHYAGEVSGEDGYMLDGDTVRRLKAAGAKTRE
jgi:hypothetical protein